MLDSGSYQPKGIARFSPNVICTNGLNVFLAGISPSPYIPPVIIKLFMTQTKLLKNTEEERPRDTIFIQKKRRKYRKKKHYNQSTYDTISSKFLYIKKRISIKHCKLREKNSEARRAHSFLNNPK